MNKISTIALIAALGLAAPAFAQTPAQLKNPGIPANTTDQTMPVTNTKRADKGTVMKDKAEVKKDKKAVHHAKHKLHHDKKQLKKDEAKKDATTGK